MKIFFNWKKGFKIVAEQKSFFYRHRTGLMYYEEESEHRMFIPCYKKVRIIRNIVARVLLVFQYEKNA